MSYVAEELRACVATGIPLILTRSAACYLLGELDRMESLAGESTARADALSATTGTVFDLLVELANTIEPVLAGTASMDEFERARDVLGAVLSQIRPPSAV